MVVHQHQPPPLLIASIVLPSAKSPLHPPSHTKATKRFFVLEGRSGFVIHFVCAQVKKQQRCLNVAKIE